MKSYKLSLIAVASAILLSGCGGGGGGSPTTVTPPVVITPAPTVTLSFASPKATVGTPVVLTWTSSNATSCTGSDGLSGSLLTGNSTTITPTVGGVAKYTVSCTGAGGSVSKSVDLITPIPVQKTSYLNFKNSGLGQITMPNVSAKYPGEYISSGIAFGDFFQDGTISAVTTSGLGLPYAHSIPGHIQFYKFVNGKPVDFTSELIDDDRNGCTGARKILVADFNADGKPDAFFACHGYDAPPYPGDYQVWLYSQPNGKYKKVVSKFLAYAHGATAADLRGDGYADIVITDTSGDFKTPKYLRNNKDETFTISDVELSPLMKTSTNNFVRPLYTLEFIDVNNDGKPDLYVGGIGISVNGPNGIGLEENGYLDAWTSKVFYNTNNTFAGNYLSIPVDPAFNGDMDILLIGNELNILRTSIAEKDGWQVQKFNLVTKSFLPALTVKPNDLPIIVNDPIKGIVLLSPFHF